MEKDQEIVLMFRGLLASLPADQQEVVRDYEKRIRAMIAENELATMAVGIIGSELAAEVDS